MPMHPAPVWRAGGVAGADGLVRYVMHGWLQTHQGLDEARAHRICITGTARGGASDAHEYAPSITPRAPCMARCRYNSRPYAHGKGALEVTGPGSGARSSPATHTSLHGMHAAGALAGVWNTARSDRAKDRTSFYKSTLLLLQLLRAAAAAAGAEHVGSGTLLHRGRPCVAAEPTSDEVLLVEPGCVANLGGMRSCGSLEGLARRATTHRAGGCDGQRASDWGDNAQSSYADAAPPRRCGGLAALLERMASDAHSTHRSHARPVLCPLPVAAPAAEAWRGAATTRGRTPTGKGALEVTGKVGCPQPPPHTHLGMHAAGERWRACAPRDQTGQ
eukprot:gene8110-5646_t